MKDVVACVVTYNRREKLENCINSLLAQDYGDFDILIVDNGSTDGTRESLQKHIDSEAVSYINTGSNLGGAGGFSFAIKRVAVKYDYIWLMDDDTYPCPHALGALIEKANVLSDRFGFLSSLVKWTDGSACVMNMQEIKKNVFESTKALENNMIPICSASFVSLFFRSEMAQKYGLPIKEFFIWGDDMEYTERISPDGGYLVLESVVVHDMHENEGVDIVFNDISRVRRYSLAIRNRIFTARKSGSIKKVVQSYLSPVKQICRVAILAKDYRIQRFCIILKGIGSSIGFHPIIEFPD